MTNREKVIANVTGIVSDMQEEVDEWKDYSDSELSHGLTCDCDWWYKTLQTLKDAIALLKAQEPVEPSKRINHSGFTYYQCGSCDAVLVALQPKYCHRCGRAVKWDG